MLNVTMSMYLLEEKVNYSVFIGIVINKSQYDITD